MRTQNCINKAYKIRFTLQDSFIAIHRAQSHAPDCCFPHFSLNASCLVAVMVLWRRHAHTCIGQHMTTTQGSQVNAWPCNKQTQQTQMHVCIMHACIKHKHCMQFLFPFYFFICKRMPNPLRQKIIYVEGCQSFPNAILILSQMFKLNTHKHFERWNVKDFVRLR